MSTRQLFSPRPLAIAIKWASLVPLLLVSHTLLGATIPVVGQVKNIDGNSGVNDYTVTNDGTLNVNGGTQHGTVTSTASTINVAAGSALSSLSVFGGSKVTMAGATINNGLSLNESVGDISNSTVVSASGVGLSVNRQQSDTIGSTVTFTDSTSTGATAGALITHFSELDLLRSHLTATGTNGVGLRVNAGVVRASDSSMTGTVNGVVMSAEQVYQDGSLTLEGSSVVGQTGAAIRVAPAAPTTPSAIATIDVNNGSTITGGNGNILEVLGASTATMNVNNSNLTGNVQVDEASTANLNFNQGSLTGDITADAGSTVNLALQQSTMTGDVVANTGSTATVALQGGALTGNVLVDGTSTATLGLNQSTMTGDVIAQPGGVAHVTLDNNSLLTGRLENTSSVAINSGSQWTMVGDATLADLSMNGGAIKFGDPASFYTLSVANLSGNGTFKMDVDFGGERTDFLNITGSATGSHSLLIGSTGTDPVNDTSLHVVHAAAGDSSFSLAGGAVDLGTWSYDLIKQGDNDWYLDASTRTISPGTSTVLALFNAAPTAWYGELSTLRTRMGELRLNGGQSGGWMRAYGNKFDVADSAGFGYRQVQQGISLGADGKVPAGDGQWLAGVMAGQSKSDLDLDRGSNGKINSYYVGAYTTWLDSDTGYYFDGVLKFNRFQNKARVNLSDGTTTKGDYNNSGVGASLEFGRHIKIG